MGHAGSVAEAREHPALVDRRSRDPRPGGTGSGEFIGAVDARVMVCSSDCAEESVLAALQAGAVGYLRKDTLTTETLGAAVQRRGQRHRRRSTPELLGNLLRRACRRRARAGRRPSRGSPIASSRCSR